MLQRRRWVILISALLVLTLPTSLAEDASGEFVTNGLAKPAGTYLTGRPEAIFANGTETLASFSISASAVDVTRVTSTIATLGNAGVDLIWLEATHDVATFRLTDVDITLLTGDHTGWFGVYPGEDASLHANSTGRVELRPCALCQKGSAVAERTPDPELLSYSYRSDRTVLETAIPGAFEHHGNAGVKIQGADILIEARENTTTERTGLRDAGALVQIFFDFHGDLTWEMDSDVELVLADCRSSFDGLLELSQASGEMRSDSSRYEVTEDTSVITGALETTVVPLEATEMHVLVTGDVRSTTLRMERLPLGDRAIAGTPLSGWIVIGIVGMVVTGGAFAYTIQRRRVQERPAAAMGVEELIDLAGLASERGDHALALGWIRRAQEQLPDHPELLQQEASSLHALGEVDDALKVIAKASANARTGEHDLLAARWLIDAGAAKHELRPWIERALERSPELFIELDDDEFEPLARLPWMQAAVERARTRFEGEQQN